MNGYNSDYFTFDNLETLSIESFMLVSNHYGFVKFVNSSFALVVVNSTDKSVQYFGMKEYETMLNY